MKMRKGFLAAVVLLTMAMMLVACGKKDDSSTVKQSNTDRDNGVAAEDSKDDNETLGNDVIKIGVNQLVKHPALDAAYEGFVDALAEAGYIDGQNIKIDYQNAQGDMATANTIATKLVYDNNDLILAIATPSAQAMANATQEIPVLITAVTDPAGSGLVESNEVPGGNISGTSDLTPVRLQIELIKRIVPDAKKIAILYCSSESNSKIQSELALAAAEELGLEAVEATVSNSNEIQQVVQSLVGKVDAIYTPTDNTIASGMQTVALVAGENGIPVICGEEGMVASGGLATIGINYYKLGKITGQQAVKLLKGEAEISTMPIEYLPDSEFAFTVNEEMAKLTGITIPADLLEQ